MARPFFGDAGAIRDQTRGALEPVREANQLRDLRVIGIVGRDHRHGNGAYPGHNLRDGLLPLMQGQGFARAHDAGQIGIVDPQHERTGRDEFGVVDPCKRPGSTQDAAGSD